jgi:hypothetical protein
MVAVRRKEKPGRVSTTARLVTVGSSYRAGLAVPVPAAGVLVLR